MNHNKRLVSLLHRLSYVQELYAEKLNFTKNCCFPPGHYYSPIISVEDIQHRQDTIWPKEQTKSVKGINLNAENQIRLVKEFEKYYNEIPFTVGKTEKNRYYFENDFYSYKDAIFLYSMIRHYSPKRIIEIGSGFSSSLMLDTNEQFFNNEIDLTFIEPYPQRLRSLFKEHDKMSNVIEKNVQDVNPEIFESLNAGDFLFVDSSHVVKTGSDLNYILFNVLPVLNRGVFIHFHDIFYPFEYPKEWGFMGRNWNEGYFLKAFLMYNSEFEIKLFAHYLHLFHRDLFTSMPLCKKNAGGNLWLIKSTDK